MEKAAVWRMRVVVAHSDEDVRAALGLLLEEAGYTVHLAPDARSGLAIVRACMEPVLVLFEMEPLGPSTARFLELALLEAARCGDGHHSAARAFVALTTMAGRLPQRLMRLLQRLEVPVVEEPFDLEPMLLVVARAASRCAVNTSEQAHYGWHG